MEEKKVRMCATCKHYRPTEGICSLSGEPRSTILDCDRFEDWHGEEEPKGWEQMSLLGSPLGQSDKDCADALEEEVR